MMSFKHLLISLLFIDCWFKTLIVKKKRFLLYIYEQLLLIRNKYIYITFDFKNRGNF